MSQYSDGDNNVDVYAQTRPKARKPHKCCACRETIPIGAIYVRTFMAWEGMGETYKHCTRCIAIYNHLALRMNKEGEEDEYPDFQLNCGHTYKKRWNEEPPPEIAALAFALPGELIA